LYELKIFKTIFSTNQFVNKTVSTWNITPDIKDITMWKKHQEILFYEKACLLYGVLAKEEYKQNK